jgi:hypothetical protein
MTHAAYLLAKLNPKNVRFDVGTVGTPELTPQDIAAAIAFVPAGLGRELLCRVWWPDGAELAARDLDNLLLQEQRAEWARREEGMYQGLAAIACHTGGESLRRAQRHYQEAHANRWPRWIDSVELGTINKVYGRIRRAAVHELVDPRRCTPCGGSGSVASRAGPIACERCAGGGVVAHNNTRRADALKVTESAYRKTWSAPYEWLLAMATDKAREAAKALERAAA